MVRHCGVTRCVMGRVVSVVASLQHAPSYRNYGRAVKIMAEWQRGALLKSRERSNYMPNPAGDWQPAVGFDADAGLTGRKLVVDNCRPATNWRVVHLA